MRRRDFLQRAVTALAGASTGALTTRAAAHARRGPLHELRASISPDDGLVLTPQHQRFEAYRSAFNKRTLARPAAIVACKRVEAVRTTIAWARSHGVPISVRSGGHSYEGLSLCPGVVIDVRPLDAIETERSRLRAAIGSGASLGQVYATLQRDGLALPAGTCAGVGIAGLTLGGGFGLLARKHGLTCDSLRALEMVDAEGRTLRADASQHQDLFWACRGGGGGSFGVVTRLELALQPIDEVVVFDLGYTLARAQARAVFHAWQHWAPAARDELTSMLVLTRAEQGQLALTCKGQFLGGEDDLHAALRPMLALAPSRRSLRSMPFIDAVHHFSPENGHQSTYMKGKSDYVTSHMADEGVDLLFDHLERLPPDEAGIYLDSYGGAINRVARSATAFHHRGDTLFSLQYHTQWSHPAQTRARLQWMRQIHAAMRPHVSGAAYVSYCDLDLPDWPRAYFGDNFERLTRVKAVYDPDDVFKHAQSIPPAASDG